MSSASVFVCASHMIVCISGYLVKRFYICMATTDPWFARMIFDTAMLCHRVDMILVYV